jgi:hypothetical protein
MIPLRINFDDVPKDLLEYKRKLYELKYNDKEIDCLMQLFGSTKYEEAYPSEYGRVIRKKKDPNKENPNYKFLPFGIKDQKILIPSFYNTLIEEYGLETIYNLCMCETTIHFWFLLTFPQKVNLYNLLLNNPDKRLFGSSDRSKTFISLFDDLSRYCFYADDITIQVIKYTNIDETKQTSEMKQMILQNMRRITTLQNFIFFLNDLRGYDKIMQDSLHEYIPFIWYLVHNNIEVTKINEEDFFINGSPRITNLSFTEPAR